MRVYISADMEGISGIVHSVQTDPESREYDRACALMLGDVNAAIAGALAGGATYVLVNDAHWSMRNLNIEGLHPAAELVSGYPKPFSMVQGLDASFDVAFFVGYHAMSGTAFATIDHTYTEDSIARITINGTVVGELGVNAFFAGHYGVPVTLVTGDQSLATEAQALLGEVTVVQVKEAYSRSAARCIPLEEARRLIREGAQAALAQRCTPFRPEPPITLLVEFMKSSHTDIAALVPSVERTGPRSVQFTHDDYLQVYRALLVMAALTEPT
jgi:D-amino peptidase